MLRLLLVVFVAQAFDLNEPFSNTTCYKATGCHDNTPVPPGGWNVSGCDQYCASVRTTNFYMGPIHPRDKKPVGVRLAKASMAVAYVLSCTKASYCIVGRCILCCVCLCSDDAGWLVGWLVVAEHSSHARRLCGFLRMEICFRHCCAAVGTTPRRRLRQGRQFQGASSTRHRTIWC